MTTIVLLLTGFAVAVSLAVLVQAFRRAAFAWSELQHALATCPEYRTGRVTHIDLKAAVAPERTPLRQVRFAAGRRQQPALRAAA